MPPISLEIIPVRGVNPTMLLLSLPQRQTTAKTTLLPKTS